MLTCSKLIPQGQGLAAVLLKRAASVELDWDVRQKSRFDATDSQGRHLGVFLPRGTVVRGGDVLLAEDGSLVRVQAAPQAVLRITHCSQHGTPFDLIRAAYHLGNRHVPIELKADHLKIEPDHVLADMLRRMHLIVAEVNDGFEPESGAYGDGHGHAGGHHHGHSHDHAAAAASHDHSHGHSHEHSHDPAHAGCCGHDHAHDHGHDHGHAHNHDGCCGHHDHDHSHAPKAQPVTRGKPVGVSIKAATVPAAAAASAAAEPAKPQHDHSDHSHGHDHAAHGGGCGCGHQH